MTNTTTIKLEGNLYNYNFENFEHEYAKATGKENIHRVDHIDATKAIAVARNGRRIAYFTSK